MKKILLFTFAAFCNCIVFSQNKNTPTVIYCIPGQGADHRLFNHFDLGKDYELRFIEYKIPKRKEKMGDYARRLATQIDTTQPYILIGTSLGGMLATEMNDFLHPQKTIIISSAKCRRELPFRYRFQRSIPLYRLVPKGLMKFGARVLQPIVEPDRKHEKATFKSMLNDKDKTFMKRSVGMIINWKRDTYSTDIVHIHGNKDKTIPIRNVKYDYLVRDGSHMVTLTRGKEVSDIILGILNE